MTKANAAVEWTPAMLQQLRALRTAGKTHDEIAAEMRLTRWSVIEELRRHPVAVSSGAPHVKPFVRSKDHGALPAGHPDTWRMLTSGTVLDGEPFPGGGRS